MQTEKEIPHILAPDTSFLVESLGLRYAIIGFYDVPSTEVFPDIVERRGCLFSSFDLWQQGKMTHISRARPGCLGSAYWLCGMQPMPQDDFLDFLVNTEGLKSDKELMQDYLATHHPYTMQNRHLCIGPLQTFGFQFCKTITIYCTPDQLSALLLGMSIDHEPALPSRLLPATGCGCFQMAGIFPSFDSEYATISSMDIAMRIHVPADILSVTVTPPLFMKLCSLDHESFFGKPFWKRLLALRSRNPHSPVIDRP